MCVSSGHIRAPEQTAATILSDSRGPVCAEEGRNFILIVLIFRRSISMGGWWSYGISGPVPRIPLYLWQLSHHHPNSVYIIWLMCHHCPVSPYSSGYWAITTLAHSIPRAEPSLPLFLYSSGWAITTLVPLFLWLVSDTYIDSLYSSW